MRYTLWQAYGQWAELFKGLHSREITFGVLEIHLELLSKPDLEYLALSNMCPDPFEVAAADSQEAKMSMEWAGKTSKMLGMYVVTQEFRFVATSCSSS